MRGTQDWLTERVDTVLKERVKPADHVLKQGLGELREDQSMYIRSVLFARLDVVHCKQCCGDSLPHCDEQTVWRRVGYVRGDDGASVRRILVPLGKRRSHAASPRDVDEGGQSLQLLGWGTIRRICCVYRFFPAVPKRLNQSWSK